MFLRMLSLALICFILHSCKNEKPNNTNTNQAAPVTEVETFVVEAQELDHVVTTHGSILPAEEVELRSEIAGRVINIGFKEGAKVSKGQMLVQIDDSELQPQLKKLQVELKIAKSDLERKRQLLDIQGISREEYESAEMKVATLEADIGIISAQIRKSKITAPFSGTVGLRLISPGAYVSVGEQIARLVQTDPVKVEFSLPEAYAMSIPKDAEISFVLTNSDKAYRAKVYAYDPGLEASTRSLKVRALAENKDGELLPGAFADLTLTLSQIKNATLAPAIAVMQDIRGQKVFIIKNGKAATAVVKTGFQQDELVLITEGLQAGDTVITTSLLSMKDGTPVKARPSN